MGVVQICYHPNGGGLTSNLNIIPPQPGWKLEGCKKRQQVCSSTILLLVHPTPSHIWGRFKIFRKWPNTIRNQIRPDQTRNRYARPTSESTRPTILPFYVIQSFQIFPIFKSFCWTKSYISSAVLYLHLRCSCWVRLPYSLLVSFWNM